MNGSFSNVTRPAMTIVSILIALGVVTSPLFATAIARTLKLESGENYTLCREYDSNLRSFPELTDTTTEWPLNPRFKNFTKPDWQRVDPAQRLDVIRNIYIFNHDPHEKLSDEEAEQYWQQNKAEVMEWISGGQVLLEKAKLDFDADGKEDVVYRYRRPTYVISGKDRAHVPVYAYWYIFYDLDTNQPIELFRRYAPWFAFGDSFLFKGRFYLIQLLGGLAIFEPHYVTSVHGLAMNPICMFRFAR